MVALHTYFQNLWKCIWMQKTFDEKFCERLNSFYYKIVENKPHTLGIANKLAILKLRVTKKIIFMQKF